MYVITAHQRHRQTDRQTDVKRSHDRYIAKACSGKKRQKIDYPYFSADKIQRRIRLAVNFSAVNFSADFRLSDSACGRTCVCWCLQGRRSLWDRGDTPPNIWTGGHYHECPPQYFWINISYFLWMQYFLDKLKEYLTFLLCKCNRKYYERNVI